MDCARETRAAWTMLSFNQAVRGSSVLKSWPDSSTGSGGSTLALPLTGSVFETVCQWFERSRRTGPLGARRQRGARRAFFLGFSQSPVEFINALIESQSRDLKLVAGEGSRSAEKERRADFFNQPW